MALTPMFSRDMFVESGLVPRRDEEMRLRRLFSECSATLSDCMLEDGSNEALEAHKTYAVRARRGPGRFRSFHPLHPINGLDLACDLKGVSRTASVVDKALKFAFPQKYEEMSFELQTSGFTPPSQWALARAGMKLDVAMMMAARDEHRASQEDSIVRYLIPDGSPQRRELFAAKLFEVIDNHWPSLRCSIAPSTTLAYRHAGIMDKGLAVMHMLYKARYNNLR